MDDGAGDGGRAAVASAPGSDVLPAPARFSGLPMEYRLLVLITVCSGLFASGLTITALTTAIPFIRRDFVTSFAAISWVVSAPFLFRSIFIPAFGKLADRIGRRRTWVWGFALTSLTSLACGFAPDVGWLIALRALSAIASAAVVPSSLALIAVEYEPHARVKAFGWWSAVSAFSPVFGVVLGGLVIDAFGWRWLFFGQFPFSVVALVAGVIVLRESKGEPAPFDVWGTVLSVLGLGLVILAINRGPVATWAWGSPQLVVCVVAAIGLLIAFVMVERRVRSPILLVDLFRRRQFTAGVLANFFGNFAYMGGFFITSLMLAEPDLWGWSAGRVSLAVAPRALALGIMGPFAGYLTARFGGRGVATVGMVLIGGSMFTLAALAPGDPYLLIVPGLVLSGIGLGLVGPPATAAVTNEAASEDLGAASAAVNLGASFGSSVGIATMQAVLLTVAVTPDAPGMRAFTLAFLAGAIGTGIGVFSTLGLGGADRVTRTAWRMRRSHS
ncbi:MAG: MFS transporter [Actinomycetes bacterium]